MASICPQSLPFFAVKFGLDITEAAHKLCGFLKTLGEQVGFIYRWLVVTIRNILYILCIKQLFNGVI